MGLLLIYSASPFINGLGCDYQQQYERGNLSFYSSCKFGYAKNIIHNKARGEFLTHQGIMGRHGDTMIFIANEITRSSAHPDIHQDVYSTMNRDFIYITKIVNRDKKAWIVMTYPYHRIQKIKTRGRQSFW
ncbi:hypothetical protein [Aeromonas cavernicola]|uniref:Uncharacterized protein n=1 Tax=Aeromonas cavernicola TaxID=1006623 RepID=A0A2H9U8I1_9GAMM|nr:hypothetical protein [Aeromonas cavernicola]PJG60353.1 hypothetical protein CUC53_02285 [Aeromonas cavernicola]